MLTYSGSRTLEAPHGNHYTPARGMRMMLKTKLATLQMLLVCESGSEMMSSVSCEKQILTPEQINLYQPLKLFVADVHLPKTRWKAVPQTWVSSRETSVPKVLLIY